MYSRIKHYSYKSQFCLYVNTNYYNNADCLTHICFHLFCLLNVVTIKIHYSIYDCCLLKICSEISVNNRHINKNNSQKKVTFKNNDLFDE